MGRGRAGAGALPARWHIPLSPLSRDFDILLQPDSPRTPQLGRGMRVTAALGGLCTVEPKSHFLGYFYFFFIGGYRGKNPKPHFHLEEINFSSPKEG